MKPTRIDQSNKTIEIRIMMTAMMMIPTPKIQCLRRRTSRTRNTPIIRI